MNRLFVLFISLMITACANCSGKLQDGHTAAEKLLSQGVLAYKKQHYLDSQKKFYRALSFYQSVDNSKGIQYARINLIEALLALNNFAEAKQQLFYLTLDKPLKTRAVLLHVKLLFQQGRYQQALTVITPLLAQENIENRMDLLATAARLEVLTAKTNEWSWLNDFQQAMLKQENNKAKYQLILKRIYAIQAKQKKQYPKALKLLNEALLEYKQQMDRRAIASCLSEMAEIEIQQNHHTQALNYLHRALAIRVWLKDQYHIDKIEALIQEIVNKQS